MDTIRNITETLSKDGDKAMERVHDVAESALEKGRVSLKELRSQGKEVLGQAQKEGQQAWDDAQKFLQKHPAKTVGVALLIGAAIGGLLMAMRNYD